MEKVEEVELRADIANWGQGWRAVSSGVRETRLGRSSATGERIYTSGVGTLNVAYAKRAADSASDQSCRRSPTADVGEMSHRRGPTSIQKGERNLDPQLQTHTLHTVFAAADWFPLKLTTSRTSMYTSSRNDAQATHSSVSAGTTCQFKLVAAHLPMRAILGEGNILPPDINFFFNSTNLYSIL